jgi:hypothetical protein
MQILFYRRRAARACGRFSACFRGFFLERCAQPLAGSSMCKRSARSRRIGSCVRSASTHRGVPLDDLASEWCDFDTVRNVVVARRMRSQIC